jgi:hypothetical protein
MNMLHLETRPALDSVPGKFPPLKKRLHLNKEAVRTLTGSEKVLSGHGRSLISCHPTSF